MTSRPADGPAADAVPWRPPGDAATGRPLRLTLLTSSFSDTQIFRAQALDLVARLCGHAVTVVTTEPGDVVASLAADPFADRLRQVTEPELLELVADGTDVLCTVKALDVSLGLGHRIAERTGRPLLADIDDPDIEVRTLFSGTTPVRSAYRMARNWRSQPRQLQLAVTARRSLSTVSNPVLQARWGGHLVPHARVDPGPGVPHVDRGPVIAFVGTVRRHKGTDLLRAAVAALAADGWRLVITDDPPADRRPWEDWTGPLDGRIDPGQVTAEADVVVVPSEDFSYARAQLPLKLIDAMLLGRAVVVSDVGPLPWAVGQTGRVFRASSLTGLVEALRPLRDPQLRAELGAQARALALQRYEAGSVAPAFQLALDEALTRAPGVRRPLR